MQVHSSAVCVDFLHSRRADGGATFYEELMLCPINTCMRMCMCLVYIFSLQTAFMLRR